MTLLRERFVAVLIIDGVEGEIGRYTTRVEAIKAARAVVGEYNEGDVRYEVRRIS